MLERKVTRTRKDKDGDILVLCNPTGYWSPRYKYDAIRDIELGIYKYYVLIKNKHVDIHVVNDPEKGKHLRTDPDNSKINDLINLPDC